VNNLLSRFSLAASIFVMGIMVGSCAKDLAANDKEILPTAANATPPTAQKQPVPVPAQLNAVAQAAQKAGVNDCLARINQISNFLTANTEQSGASLTVAPQTPNEHSSSIAFEIKSPKVLSYASADFSPLAVGCGGTYEKVTHWQNNCKDVASKGYAQFKFIGVIQKSILVLEGGPQSRVYLMPAGKDGCVAIQKEVVY
jgi:hypothetical protein